MYPRAPDLLPWILPEMLDTDYWISRADNPDEVILTLDEIRRQFPQLAKSCPAMPHPWFTTGPEDIPKVVRRVAPVIDSLIKTGNGDYLLVGHGASVNACIEYLGSLMPGTDVSEGHNWNCSLTVVEVAPGGQLKLLTLRDVSFMPKDMISSNLHRPE